MQSAMVTSGLTGFSVSLTLIVAIGAQNAFLLRQGLRREHVVPLVVICAVSDALLIAAGIGGLGALVTDRPLLLTAATWGGAAFLLGYGAIAARRALRPDGALLPTDRPATSLRAAVLTCLALTYLNPHVYLDTVLLIGSIAQRQAHVWIFGAGAMIASAVWFTALGFTAQRLAGVLRRPAAWRALDGTVAVIMWVVAASLLIG